MVFEGIFSCDWSVFGGKLPLVATLMNQVPGPHFIESCYDSNTPLRCSFQYYNQSISRIPAVVMAVAILAELLSWQLSMKWVPDVLRRCELILVIKHARKMCRNFFSLEDKTTRRSPWTNKMSKHTLRQMSSRLYNSAAGVDDECYQIMSPFILPCCILPVP